MINEFKKYKGFEVLAYFLENPTQEIHIKELARILKISPATSKNFCDLFAKEKILLSEKKSNSIFFKLNNEDSYVLELKRFYAINKFKDKIDTSSLDGIFNIAIYGSYSSGKYTEKSDVDLLIIARKKDVDISSVLDFQKKIKKEINVTKMTLEEWNKLKDKKDVFAQEVLNNNFPLFGEKLT